MKIAVISDIHSNSEAMLAVFRDIKAQHIETIYCLGDIVGYGPTPWFCWREVVKKCQIIIKGNHEDGVCDPEQAKELTRYAIEGVKYSRENMEEDQIKAMSELPLVVELPELELTLCHSSWTEPRMYKYLDTEEKAAEELKVTPTRICLIGHTHSPYVFGSENGLYQYIRDDMVLDPKQKFLINVGSVGQPRDGDVRACYGVFEVHEETKKIISFNLRRIFYNIAKVEEEIREANLSSFLSERLYKGA